MAQPTKAFPTALCQACEASARAPIAAAAAAALQAEIVRSSRRLPVRHHRRHGARDRPSRARRRQAIDLKK